MYKFCDVAIGGAVNCNTDAQITDFYSYPMLPRSSTYIYEVSLPTNQGSVNHNTIWPVAQDFRPSGENHSLEKAVTLLIAKFCPKYSCSGRINRPCCQCTSENGPKFLHMT